MTPEQQTAERVNGWLREVVEDTGLCGTRAVTLVRMEHLDATPQEKRHLDSINRLMRDVEISAMVIRPESLIKITGVS